MHGRTESDSGSDGLHTSDPRKYLSSCCKLSHSQSSLSLRSQRLLYHAAREVHERLARSRPDNEDSFQGCLPIKDVEAAHDVLGRQSREIKRVVADTLDEEDGEGSGHHTPKQLDSALGGSPAEGNVKHSLQCLLSRYRNTMRGSGNHLTLAISAYSMRCSTQPFEIRRTTVCRLLPSRFRHGKA